MWGKKEELFGQIFIEFILSNLLYTMAVFYILSHYIQQSVMNND